MLRLAVALSAAALLAPGAPAAAAERAREPSVARGLPWAGSLAHGALLPAGGPAHFTWDPILKRSPNRTWRRWGTDRLVRTVRRVLAEYARAYPWAPPVGVGDLSRRHGGEFGARFGYPGHASHQNGLDVDVYYPRRDRRLRPPDRPSQLDRRLSQALVDRFVRSGASKIFVGPSTGLTGPRGVVSILPTWHDNHMHVRLPARPCMRPVENRVHGYVMHIPCGWRARIREDGSTNVAFRSAEIRVLATSDRRPATRAAHLRYGSPRASEGIGRAHEFRFAVQRRVFHASIRLAPRSGAAVRTRALAVLRSVRLTPRAFRIANERRRLDIGRSVAGRPLHAWRIGNPRSRRRVLVVGCIHGDECAATLVTQRLVNNVRPLAGELVVVGSLNPDGRARGVRWNARGVDLNRNFGAGWRAARRHGRLPFSEPEARAARALIRRLRPTVTVWFHQPEGLVRAWGRSVPAARRYARAVRLPFAELPWIGGSAPQWQNRRLRQVSFVVELPARDLSGAAADRHARALLALVR